MEELEYLLECEMASNSRLGGDSLVRWILSLRFPARRPLVPGTSVVIRDELVDELAAELVV